MCGCPQPGFHLHAPRRTDWSTGHAQKWFCRGVSCDSPWPGLTPHPHLATPRQQGDSVNGQPPAVRFFVVVFPLYFLPRVRSSVPAFQPLDRSGCSCSSPASSIPLLRVLVVRQERISFPTIQGCVPARTRSRPGVSSEGLPYVHPPTGPGGPGPLLLPSLCPPAGSWAPATGCLLRPHRRRVARYVGVTSLRPLLFTLSLRPALLPAVD